MDSPKPRGFDDYDLRLGDVMRGERATLGKSLLDVEREIRIRATYIAAIEKTDPDAFDTPGFIPGYVRSYARYLRMDPEETFRQFCVESGFSPSHGMAAGARRIHEAGAAARRETTRARDPIAAPSTPFLPERESILSHLEPRAIGSALILLALISAIGYGGWSVLREIQQVQVAPAENSPDVMTDLDPLDAARPERKLAAGDDSAAPTGEDGLDRLYRPAALDLPVMVARDAPISSLDPAQVGTFHARVSTTTDRDAIAAAVASAVGSGEAPDAAPAAPRVVGDTPPKVRLVAVRPAWVRVRAADNSVIFEGVIDRGDSYEVPTTEEPPTLRVGASGSVYFEVGGQRYGPVGPRGSVTSGVVLAADKVTERFAVADPAQDRDLMRYVAELDQGNAANE